MFLSPCLAVPNRSNNPDKALQAAFSKLGDLAEKLRLTNPTIKNTACELYKRGTESHKLRGRSTDVSGATLGGPVFGRSPLTLGRAACGCCSGWEVPRGPAASPLC